MAPLSGLSTRVPSYDMPNDDCSVVTLGRVASLEHKGTDELMKFFACQSPQTFSNYAGEILSFCFCESFSLLAFDKKLFLSRREKLGEEKLQFQLLPFLFYLLGFGP